MKFKNFLTTITAMVSRYPRRAPVVDTNPSPWDGRAHHPGLIRYTLRMLYDDPSLVNDEVLSMMEGIMEKHRRDDS